MDHISAASSKSATPRIPAPVAYLARDETAECPRITNLRAGVTRAQKAAKRTAESPSTLRIPQELWYPRHHDPDAAPLPAPRLSIVTKLLPLAALIFGYTAAVAFQPPLRSGGLAVAVRSIRMPAVDGIRGGPIRLPHHAVPPRRGWTMSGPTRLPLWLRLAGTVVTLLGAGGAVAASAHLTVLAVLVLAAAGVIVLSVALVTVVRARS